MIPDSSIAASFPANPGTSNTVEPPEGDFTMSKRSSVNGWLFKLARMMSRALFVRAR